jgi:DNA mismatch repair protein MutS
MTPMLEQYFDIKKRHPTEIVLFRLGDFYEMFGEDAVLASQVLDITLTARYKNTDHEIPMCGVPHHSVEAYVAKLTLSGLRVALCDQLSDTRLPGIVDRAVTRVITPGTTLNDEVIHPKENHYLAAIVRGLNAGKSWGLAHVDITTGEFRATELSVETEVEGELSRLSAAEILVQKDEHGQIPSFPFFSEYFLQPIDKLWKSPNEIIFSRFHVEGMRIFGLENRPLASAASAMILTYLESTQKQALEHINNIVFYSPEHFLLLDEATLRNLEIFQNSYDRTKKNTLINVVDETVTAAGGRLLRQWILRPLQDVEAINGRLDCVDALRQNHEVRRDLRLVLRNIADIERLLSRIVCTKANARDLVSLKQSLREIPRIQKLLKTTASEKWQSFEDEMETHNEIASLVDQAIIEEPPPTVLEGGFIKTGYHAALDELKALSFTGKDWIARLQEQERERTKIHSLKVGFNNVFGYYIEVTHANRSSVPQEYIRKQTLANAERYITPELKEYEEKVLGAEEKMKELEWKLFSELLQQLKSHIKVLQDTARKLATIDIYACLAEVAWRYHYQRPIVDEGDRIFIKDGRHPVIESIQKDPYIPNSLYLDHADQETIIITGPNMSGKSSFIRQNALLILLAHMGSFVPASYAEIGVVDRIFTRVGASDNLAEKQSTFMVEMQEAAYIMRNATHRSFIIFDELGRGTSTYDGVSIAWAIAGYIHERIGALTLFATHYHELMKLSEIYPRIKNFSVKVKETADGEVVFLHEVVPGGVDKSYGIDVAKLAGLPKEVVTAARKMLEQLMAQSEKREQGAIQQAILFEPTGVDTVNTEERKVCKELLSIDPNVMTPLEALAKIQEWKGRLAE